MVSNKTDRATPPATRIGHALTGRRLRRIEREFRDLPYIREISPEDEMKGRVENYYLFGLAALDYIRVALRAAEFPETPRKILDLPCGHGRVLRMLQAGFPEAQLTACDLNRDGVAYCAETFGATPVISRENPEEVELPDRYDLIWVGSLLTHLDAPYWRGFLGLFTKHLAPGGVLVFTSSGRIILDEVRAGGRNFRIPDENLLIADYDRTGFAYQNYVGHPAYGISAARPSWVCSRLEEYPDLQVIMYTEGGWNGRQDAIVCRRGGD